MKLQYFTKVVYSLKQFVFTIDSDEIIISAYGLMEAVTQVKQIMKVTEGERNLKFIGVKY
jgi:hypothetical protein